MEGHKKKAWEKPKMDTLNFRKTLGKEINTMESTQGDVS